MVISKENVQEELQKNIGSKVYTAVSKFDLNKVKINMSTEEGVGTTRARKHRKTNQETEDDSPRSPCAEGKSNENMVSIKQKHKYKMLKIAITIKLEVLLVNGQIFKKDT